MIKPSDRKKITYEKAEKLSKKLVDKPYGGELVNYKVTKTATLPKRLVDEIEMILLENKISGSGIRTFSMIAQKALEKYVVELKNENK